MNDITVAATINPAPAERLARSASPAPTACPTNTVVAWVTPTAIMKVILAKLIAT